MWNGTTASLKPTPVSIRTRPVTYNAFCTPDTAAPNEARLPRLSVPDTAYTSAIPNTRKAEVVAASTRYFSPASTATARTLG